MVPHGESYLFTFARPSSISANYGLPASHPGERDVYNSLREEFWWPQKASNVYVTIPDYRFYAQNRTHGKWQRLLKLFFPEGPSEYLVTNILRPRVKTEPGVQLAVMRTHHYTEEPKLYWPTKLILTTKTNITTIPCIFLEHSVGNYCTSCRLRTDNSPRICVQIRCGNV